MTHAERLLWLAEQEENCRALPTFKGGPDDQSHRPGCECSGTGKVARFPTLRQECPTCKGTTIRNAALVLGVFDGRDCVTCQGRGWVPVDSLEAVVDALFMAGFAVMFERHFHTAQSSSEHFICRLFPLSGERQTSACGNTPGEAAIAALYESKNVKKAK